MNKRIFLPMVLGMLSANAAQADEGQWQPHQLKQLQKEFTRVGIKLPAKQVADLNQYPLNAVIGLGYCSASFVSPEGLVVTNHHCAYGAIQYNTTVNNNLTRDGFLARTKAEEPSAGPQERLYITEQVEDVTDKVIGGLDKNLSGKKGYDAIQSKRKALIAECETSPDYRCSVKSFHHGMQYFLLKQLMIKDVRLVYAPPDAIGNFGGDIDNYEYPRHAGDFSFFRAYVDKSGKPAPYSKDNVPYRPKSWLKINADGVKKGDGILLAGYPGRTSRYKLADEIDFAANWLYPANIDLSELTLSTIDETTANRPAAKVSYSSTVKSINNRMKKYRGLLDGFKVTDIHAIKQDKENTLLKWIAEKPSRAAYADAYEKLKSQLNESFKTQKRDFYYSYAQYSGLLGAAKTLYRMAKEAEKPDAERKIGYQQRDLAMRTARLKRLQKRFDAKVDSSLWAAYLEKYVAQPHRVEVFDKALGLPASADRAQLEQLIAPYYQNTRLGREQDRLAWIGKPVSAFEQSDDPFIRLAVALYDTNLGFEEQREELQGKLAQTRPLYMKAIIDYNESLGLPVYPDANGTLRVTYGTVGGYPARDGVYKTPFTSVEGLLAKDTGVPPFNLPDKVKKAIVAGNYGSYLQKTLERPVKTGWVCRLFDCYAPKPAPFNSVPVDFLSSADTTGGNSGSPVLNAKGELVGLNFDSTYESITKDWYFNSRITRAIHVDIRYLLWMLDVVEHADNLLGEMTIVHE